MDHELLRQIWPIFSAEARESVEALSRGLMEMERAASERPAGTLQSILRTAHNLKGSAASLGFVDVEQLAHALESALAGCDPEGPLPAARVEAGLRALAALESALAAGDGGRDVSIPELGELLRALAASAGQGSGARPPSRPVQAQAGGDDALGSELWPLFRAEAHAALKRLSDALQTPLATEEQQAHAREATHELSRLAASVGLAELERPVKALGEAIIEAVRQAWSPAAIEILRLLHGPVVAEIEALERHASKPQRPSTPAPAAEEAHLAEAAPAGPAQVDRSIRVSSQLVDGVALQVEAMMLARARHERRARSLRELAAASQELGALCERTRNELRTTVAASQHQALDEMGAGLQELRRELERLATEGLRDAEELRIGDTVIRDSLRSLRMVPAAQLLEPLRRTVRDVAGRLKKRVELRLSGGEVRLDRRIADELRDPLMHLVRNAIDHGLESPELRQERGKPAAGTLEVSVEQRGGRMAITCRDDGGGLAIDRIREKAVRQGLLDAAAAAELSDEAAAQLIFRAGFSTARQVTEVSGRGVGLDVVQAAAARLQGSAAVRFEPGRGTTFTLDLPLTLAATTGVVLEAGRSRVALAADGVERVLRLEPKELATVGGKRAVVVDKQQLSFVTLAELLELPTGRLPFESGGVQLAVVVRAGAQRAVVAVDSVLAMQELVIQPLESKLVRLPHVAGAAVLDDGHVVAVLNPAELMRRALASVRRGGERERRRILVVDDSPTTSAAMRALLELAGYAVVTASNGAEALELLGESSFALVVSDVEMPVLDGLGLTRAIRRDPTLSRTPLILVTSLDRPEDRDAGLEAGADRYVVKREVQRGKLLEYVRQLVPGQA